ncbi:hypothetical protein [Streptococcus plurextorum]|uniref:hypothetical protein n=1 Tax=Streptococcus plurextorum TaxID=456876 RepID=UPI0004082276|nr:hypothetical protein [Streptococcus plurextorum]
MENMYIYIPIVLVVFIGAGIYGVFMNKKMKASSNAYLEQHPDAARIFIPYQQTPVSSGSIIIDSVDGEKPAQSFEGSKGFVYVAPGTRIIEASFTSTRPGVMHKTVSKTWGPVKLELDIKPNATYELTFDKKAEQFELIEK